MNEDIALWIDDDDDKDMDKDEDNEKMMKMIQRMTLHNSRLLKPVHKGSWDIALCTVQFNRVEQIFVSRKKWKFSFQ